MAQPVTDEHASQMESVSARISQAASKPAHERLKATKQENPVDASKRLDPDPEFWEGDKIKLESYKILAEERRRGVKREVTPELAAKISRKMQQETIRRGEAALQSSRQLPNEPEEVVTDIEDEEDWMGTVYNPDGTKKGNPKMQTTSKARPMTKPEAGRGRDAERQPGPARRRRTRLPSGNVPAGTPRDDRPPLKRPTPPNVSEPAEPPEVRNYVIQIMSRKHIVSHEAPMHQSQQHAQLSTS